MYYFLIFLNINQGVGGDFLLITIVTVTTTILHHPFNTPYHSDKNQINSKLGFPNWEFPIGNSQLGIL